MKSPSWVSAAIVISLSAGVVVGYLLASAGEVPTASDSADGVTASDYLREAAQLVQSPPAGFDSDSLEQKLDLLSRLAIRRQQTHPVEVPDGWVLFAHLVEMVAPPKSGEHEQPLDRLTHQIQLFIGYQDELEDAALACQSRSDLDHVWQTRDQAAAKIGALRVELVGAVQERLNGFRDQTKEKELAAALNRFAELKQDLDGPILTLVGTSTAQDDDEELQRILTTATELLERGRPAVQRFKDQSDEIAAKLRDVHSPIEPARSAVSEDGQSSPSPGNCEQIIAQLRTLGAALDRADLNSWLAILTRLKETPAGDKSVQVADERIPAANQPEAASARGDLKSIGQEMADIEVKLVRLQQLAYNLYGPCGKSNLWKPSIPGTSDWAGLTLVSSIRRWEHST